MPLENKNAYDSKLLNQTHNKNAIQALLKA